MQTPEKLAKEYINSVYNGDLDFYDETLNVINFILKNNIILDHKFIQDDYKTCTKFCEQAKQITDKSYWLGRKITYEGFVNINILR